MPYVLNIMKTSQFCSIFDILPIVVRESYKPIQMECELALNLVQSLIHIELSLERAILIRKVPF